MSFAPLAGWAFTFVATYIEKGANCTFAPLLILLFVLADDIRILAKLLAYRLFAVFGASARFLDVDALWQPGCRDALFFYA